MFVISGIHYSGRKLYGFSMFLYSRTPEKMGFQFTNSLKTGTQRNCYLLSVFHSLCRRLLDRIMSQLTHYVTIDVLCHNANPLYHNLTHYVTKLTHYITIVKKAVLTHYITTNFKFNAICHNKNKLC